MTPTCFKAGFVTNKRIAILLVEKIYAREDSQAVVNFSLDRN